MKTHSKTDWQSVQREARENAPIPFDPETGPYDPNDPAAVAAFFAQATVRRPGQRGSGKKPRKVLLSVRYSAGGGLFQGDRRGLAGAYGRSPA